MTSELIRGTSPQVYEKTYREPELISENEISRLFRVKRDGKYFIIKTARDSSERLVSILRREYEISADLSHNNIVNVFTYEQDTPVGCGIVMEYVNGRTLDAFLAENPSGSLCRRVLDQILSAVSYLHGKGIIHNDLKPGNILVTYSDNSVKLIDFGLSDDDAHYLLKTPGCTPAFASPELLEGKGALDSRSDIYSLGLLIRLLTGNRFRFVHSKCTRKRPENRYSNVGQIQKSIQNYFLPLKISVASVLLLAAAVFGKMSYDKYDELRNIRSLYEAQREVELFRDSVITVIDLKYDVLFSDCRKSIEKAEDLQEAWEFYEHLYSSYLAIRDSLVDLTADPALKSIFDNYCTMKFEKFYHTVKDPLFSKPVRTLQE
ncbi:MAG: serine/threonine protein kinase [Candidatus Cryptobacteroides sp.]